MNTTEQRTQLSPEELAVIELNFKLDIAASADAHAAAAQMSSEERAETEANALRKLRHLALDSLPLLRKEAI